MTLSLNNPSADVTYEHVELNRNILHIWASQKAVMDGIKIIHYKLNSKFWFNKVKIYCEDIGMETGLKKVALLLMPRWRPLMTTGIDIVYNRTITVLKV